MLMIKTKKMENINKNERFLKVDLQGNTVILYINYCILLENKTYEYRDEIIEYFEKLNNDDSAKVVVISNDHADFSIDKFKQIWNSLFIRDDYEESILRVFRIYDQMLLKIKSLNKVVMSMDSGYLNPMLFNFGMAADIRMISSDFYIDNDNTNMLNTPKGGCVYSEASIKTYTNPVNLLFLTDKLFAPELLQNNLVDKVFDNEALKDKTFAIAKKFEGIDYSEIEAVKALHPRKLRKLELALQRENEFLMSCIRKRRNQKTQEIHRFH